MDGRLAGRISGDQGEVSADGWLTEDWSRELAKHLVPAARLLPDVTLQTMLGPYHLDLVVQLGSLRIGLTRDEGGSFAGLWRDAALVGGGAVAVVYRLRAVDLHNHAEDCLYLIARADPRPFSERGRINLDRLASDTIVRCRFPQEELIVAYPKLHDEDVDEDPSGDPEDVVVEPRPRETEGSLHVIRRDRALLQRAYTYIRRAGARTVDDVMQRFAAEQLADPDDDDT